MVNYHLDFAFFRLCGLYTTYMTLFYSRSCDSGISKGSEPDCPCGTYHILFHCSLIHTKPFHRHEEVRHFSEFFIRNIFC